MTTKHRPRFWLSWPQPTEDFRPLTDPPVEGILGWWCSGYDTDNRPLLCALVSANTLISAKALIRQSWPEAPPKKASWRIEQEHPLDFVPGDRFPLMSWMRKRLADPSVAARGET